MIRERRTVSVAWACGFFEKSRQAYYRIRRRKDAVGVSAELIVQYVQAHRREQPKVGTRKLYEMLQPQMRTSGIRCGRDKLFMILRHTGLLIRKRRTKCWSTQSLPLSRHFPNLTTGIVLDAPEQVWVSDTTGIPVCDGIGYLTMTTDAYSRRIMGYHLQRSKASRGALTTLRMALGNRQYPERQLIHHSDGGGEYFSHTYLRALTKVHVRASCTAPSSPHENAIAERINGIIKNELLIVEELRSFMEVRKRLPEAIRIYNEVRPHSSIDNMTPQQAHQCSGLLRKRWKVYRRRHVTNDTHLSRGRRIKLKMDSWI